jgi:hypothetical protein
MRGDGRRERNRGRGGRLKRCGRKARGTGMRRYILINGEVEELGEREEKTRIT